MKELIHKKVVVFLMLLFVETLPLAGQPVPRLKPYRVKEDLSNISNLKEFKEALEYYKLEFYLTEKQKEKLVENGFVVIPSWSRQFFHVYESPHYGIKPRIPNFVTSDCILHTYHLLYDHTLRAVEVQKLLPSLWKLTQAMLRESRKLYRKVSDPRLKEASQRNLVFFGVASRLLKSEGLEIPEEPSRAVELELKKIQEHRGREKSSIFPFEHDYSQYIVRGHYTSSEELRRYFLSMMWYGQNAFPFVLDGSPARTEVLQTELIVWLLFNSSAEGEPLIKLWDRIYYPTTLYVGSSDDLTPHEVYELIREVYGEKIEIGDLADSVKLERLIEKAKDLKKPRIVSGLLGLPQGLQFRFMGQKYIPDSYILQKLSKWPQRPFPKGLDVMAVLGSQRAETILDSVFHEPDRWKDYVSMREKLKEEFSTLGREEWFQSLFFGWLYTLKALLREWGEGYPSFMRNHAWVDKELNTALASWTELRHDVILYGKPSGAEGEIGVEEVPQPKGYVEPVPEFYDRLLRLVELNRQVLLEYDCLTERLKRVFDSFEDLILFLRDVSEKELMNQPLSDEEYERIRYIGGTLEDLSASLVEISMNLPSFDWTTGKLIYGKPVRVIRGWFEITGPGRDMACIVDVHTSEDECLEEAVGHANTIYVVVPIGDKLYLTRGAVFSYYEFKYPVSHRLTDEAWQEMIERWRAPDPPPWTASFLAH